MNHFYFVNCFLEDTQHKLISEMKEALELKKIPYGEFKAQDIVLDLGDGSIATKPKLIIKNQVFSLEDIYVWIRIMKSDERIIALLTQLLKYQGSQYNGDAFLKSKKISTKPMQAVHLACANIPIPHTIALTPEAILTSSSYIEDVIQFPLVLKVDGSQGKGVIVVNSIKEIQDFLAMQDSERREVIVLQKLVSADSDIRALFCQEHLISAMERSSEGFLNNFSQGGSVQEYHLSDSELEICRKAWKISGHTYGGVDFMHDKDGNIYILELQRGPWTDGMRKVYPKLNIGAQIINNITK